MRRALSQTLVRRVMLVVVTSLTVAGLVLIVAAIVALLAGRGGLGLTLFAAGSFALAILTVGWAVAQTVLRISGRSRAPASSDQPPPDSSGP